MKKNKDTCIPGNRVVLVPYTKEHVLKYHGWMQSAELQKLTGSEPLNLDQEYQMQQSWFEDYDKCTFILLDAKSYDGTNDVECMIGDVNLFFNDENDRSSAEIEIMIAEESYRGKGCGKEALLIMMRYGMQELGISTCTAKIGYENKPSLTMFEKIGFREVSRSDVFQEVTLALPLTKGSDKYEWLLKQTNHVQLAQYAHR